MIMATKVSDTHMYFLQINGQSNVDPKFCMHANSQLVTDAIHDQCIPNNSNLIFIKSKYNNNYFDCGIAITFQDSAVPFLKVSLNTFDEEIKEEIICKIL